MINECLNRMGPYFLLHQREQGSTVGHFCHLVQQEGRNSGSAVILAPEGTGIENLQVLEVGFYYFSGLRYDFFTQLIRSNWRLLAAPIIHQPIRPAVRIKGMPPFQGLPYRVQTV